jgi:hypothetical protein
MASNEERLKILDMIEKGLISAEDAIQLLQALDPEQAEIPAEVGLAETPVTASTAESVPFVDGSESFTQAERVEYEADSEEEEPSPFEPQPEILRPPKAIDSSALKWRSFWWIPMWVGVGITVVAAWFMYWAWSASGFGFWFACTWLPFLLGVLVMALAWSSRTARWLHVRVHQKPGEKPERIAISLPIPLRLTAWFLRIFGKKIPNMGNTSLDEVIMALDATSPEAPFYVEVNEGDDGERVEVYIG